MSRQTRVNNIPLIKGELAQIENELVNLQTKFVAKQEELQELYAFAQTLKKFSLREIDLVSWASICRKKNWQAQGARHHLAVKQVDPSLHIFLHKFIFDNACALDKVSYV